MRRFFRLAIARLSRQEGSNTVEMAFACTVVMAMLFGIFEMSIAMFAYHITSDAAREATRYAMVRGNTSCTNTPSLSNCGATSDQIQTWVRNLNYPGITKANLTVTTTWCAANTTTTSTGSTTTWSSCSGATAAAPGNLVKATVSYPFALNIPFSRRLSLNLGSTSEMVISQ